MHIDKNTKNRIHNILLKSHITIQELIVLSGHQLSEKAVRKYKTEIGDTNQVGLPRTRGQSIFFPLQKALMFLKTSEDDIVRKYQLYS
jgi:hypothetical protein